MLRHFAVIFNKSKYEKYQFSIRNGGYQIHLVKMKDRRNKTVDSYVVYVDSLENVV
jgi:hypothetical protein